ncbi:MAG: hypothetical protein HOE82_11105 [Gammaproteobacteria bacterium]|jgi:hypothetical protein|nr:hypothetical protein [Gammaproteobacteria bacterium]
MCGGGSTPEQKPTQQQHALAQIGQAGQALRREVLDPLVEKPYLDYTQRDHTDRLMGQANADAQQALGGVEAQSGDSGATYARLGDVARKQAVIHSQTSAANSAQAFKDDNLMKSMNTGAGLVSDAQKGLIQSGQNQQKIADAKAQEAITKRENKMKGLEQLASVAIGAGTGKYDSFFNGESLLSKKLGMGD